MSRRACRWWRIAWRHAVRSRDLRRRRQQAVAIDDVTQNQRSNLWEIPELSFRRSSWRTDAYFRRIVHRKSLTNDVMRTKRLGRRTSFRYSLNAP